MNCMASNYSSYQKQWNFFLMQFIFSFLKLINSYEYDLNYLVPSLDVELELNVPGLHTSTKDCQTRRTA